MYINIHRLQILINKLRNDIKKYYDVLHEQSVNLSELTEGISIGEKLTTLKFKNNSIVLHLQKLPIIVHYSQAPGKFI